MSVTVKPASRRARPSEPGRVVRAVLVVDVPESELAQDPAGVGDLGEHRRFLGGLDRPPQQPEEVAHRGDVLHGVAGDDQIAGQPGVLLAVEGADQHDRAIAELPDGRPAKARVDPDTPANADLGQEHQEVTLSAPHLEHALAHQPIPLHQVAGELAGELGEQRREGLRLLGGLSVIDLLRVEADVGDEPASGAQPSTRSPVGYAAAGGRSGSSTQLCVGISRAAKNASRPSGTATRAGGGGAEVDEVIAHQGAQVGWTDHRTVGCGTGTMKRPPLAAHTPPAGA